MYVLIRRAVLGMLVAASPVKAAEQLDPATQLTVCQGMRAIFINDSEQAQALWRQSLAEIADLKKQLAEAQAKIPAPEPKD